MFRVASPVWVLVFLALSWLPAPAQAEETTERDLRALKKDGSHKVRTQAALVLGREKVREAVPALCQALTTDDSESVRIAAATALGRIGDIAGRRSLEEARHTDPDPRVRAAAEKALEALAERSVGVGSSLDIEGPTGEGSNEARGSLGTALAKHLKAKGFVTQGGGRAVYRVKPTIQSLQVKAEGNQISVTVQVTVVAIESDGRVAAMLQSGARLKASGARSSPALEAKLSEQALDAAARTLSDDLASKLQ
jgi:hypothetical protein